MGRIFGYSWVPAKGHEEENQLMAFTEYGIDRKLIYLDRLTPKSTHRPAYSRMLNALRQEDVVVLHSIDRLGRNYDEIIEQWQLLTKEVLADIVVLDMPLLDTRRRDAEALGINISDLVLQILSYVSQCDRKNIRQRQREGIDEAMKNGVRFGRPPKRKPDHFQHVAQRWMRREISSREAAAILGISQDTFLRWTRQSMRETDKETIQR